MPEEAGTATVWLMRGTRAAVASAAVVLTAWGLTGCSDDQQPAVCDDIDALQNSVDNIQNAQVSEGGLSVISDELNTIDSEVDQLVTDAGDEYGDEVDAVRAAVRQLGDDIDAAATDPTSAAISTVVDDVDAVATALSDLTGAVGDTC